MIAWHDMNIDVELEGDSHAVPTRYEDGMAAGAEDVLHALVRSDNSAVTVGQQSSDEESSDDEPNMDDSEVDEQPIHFALNMNVANIAQDKQIVVSYRQVRFVPPTTSDLAHDKPGRIVTTCNHICRVV